MAWTTSRTSDRARRSGAVRIRSRAPSRSSRASVPMRRIRRRRSSSASAAVCPGVRRSSSSRRRSPPASRARCSRSVVRTTGSWASASRPRTAPWPRIFARAASSSTCFIPRSSAVRASAAVAILIGARCFVEAVAFTMIAALAHVATTGILPLPVVPWTLVLFGVGILLVTIQREVRSERRGTTILVVTLAAGVVWGLALPARDPDGLAVLSRMVAFGLIAEGFLWRNLSIARGAVRWGDSRSALLFAGSCIGLAALASGPIDHGPLAVLALLVVALSGLALSLARTTEELALARGTRGAPDDEELLRQIEQTRPIVFGAVEMFIVLGAALVALFLFDRMLRERRLELPEGVTLERGAAEGFGLGDMLRRLRRQRGVSRRAPRDDGSPSGALRLLYWRFLTLAERA